MAQFLELNIPEYTVSQDAVNILSGNRCFCCLAKNEIMINLTNCEHSEFLEYFTTLDPTVLVCQICHNMLVKICMFKKQVAECSRIMNLKLQIEQKTIKLHNLKQSKTTITSNKTEIENKKSEVKDELESEKEDSESDFHDTVSSQNHTFEIKTKARIEQDDSDFENLIPLATISKKKKLRKAKSLPVVKTEEKYFGKIGYIVMSREELMEEREKESKKESYLKLPFKCESCIKGFDLELTLKGHNKKLHDANRGSHVCDICKSVLRSENSYKEHTKRHFRRFVCIACRKCAIDIYSICQHFNQQHGDTLGVISMQFRCEQCDFTTDSHRAHRYHREKHKKTQCNICGNTFANNNSLKVHMNALHRPSPLPYTCSACHKSYKSKSGLFNHTEAMHDAAPAAYCARCRTHFATRSNLAHHLKTHSAHVTDNNKKYACQECDSKFINKPALQNHVDWDHRRIPKFKCNKCTKVFKTAVTLKRHGRFVHEKLRPPRDKICDYCGRAFTTARILITHIRTHTGERPLQCVHCPATFAHAAALYTHKKLLHKK